MRAIATAAGLAACVMASGCMMSSAGVRQWKADKLADQAAEIQMRVAAGDQQAQAQAAVDVFALTRELQNGYLADWWAMAKDAPWTAIWRGTTDVALLLGIAYGGYAAADSGGDSKKTTTTTIPPNTIIYGDVVTQTAGGNASYEKTEMAGD